MSTGNAEGYFEFFPEERIPDGLQLVLDAWRKLPSPARTDLEDKITERLAAAMKREKKARQLGFSIHFQAIPLGPDGAVAARIDFKFLAGYDEDAYLAFECKRLRIPRESGLDHNTDAYVLGEGMGRFISGKYAPTQVHGAMIAYVMDGKVTEAKQSVMTLIVKHRDPLALESGDDWEDSQFLPKANEVRQTRHRPGRGTPSERRLDLQHIFLAV